MSKKRRQTLHPTKWATTRKNWFIKYPDINGMYVCWICKQEVSKDTVSLDHVMSVDKWPEYAFNLTNLRPSHTFCNQERDQSTLTKLRSRKILRKVKK